MTERCPFCNEPAISEHVSGFTFRCGTYGPDSKGEYATGHTCDIATYNRLLRKADAEIERLRLWLLGIMEQYSEMSDVNPLDTHQENVWHGVVRVTARDGTSEMYFTESKDEVADWTDSPLGAVEWVVRPKGIEAAEAAGGEP